MPATQTIAIGTPLSKATNNFQGQQAIVSNLLWPGEWGTGWGRERGMQERSWKTLTCLQTQVPQLTKGWGQTQIGKELFEVVQPTLGLGKDGRRQRWGN